MIYSCVVLILNRFNFCFFLIIKGNWPPRTPYREIRIPLKTRFIPTGKRGCASPLSESANQIDFHGGNMLSGLQAANIFTTA